MATKDSPRLKKKKDKESRKSVKGKNQKGARGKEKDENHGANYTGPVLLSPFDELGSVWVLPSRKEQRKLIGELFEIADGAGLCRDSILLDMAYLDLVFAHQAGFNLEQTKVFWNIMQTIQTNLCDHHCTLEKTTAFFKKSLLENSVYHTHYNHLQPTKAALSSERESRASIAEDEKIELDNLTEATRGSGANSRLRKSGNPSRASSQANKKGAKDSNAPASGTPFNTAVINDDDDDVTQAPPNPARLFTAENVKQLTEYFVSGLLSHYRLYRCVINEQAFQPCKQVETHTFRIETIVPEQVKLDQATGSTESALRSSNIRDDDSSQVGTRDLDIPEFSDRSEEEIGTRELNLGGEDNIITSNNPDPVLNLVERHTLQAKAEMQKMLDANNRALEARLAEALGEGATNNSTPLRTRKVRA